jgi:hypothetical protein
MTEYTLFHVDTNAQDNTGVVAPSGTEAGKPVQPDQPISPFAPTPSNAPNPVIAPSGEPVLPGVPTAPVQNPPVHPDIDKVNAAIGFNQPDKKTLGHDKQAVEAEEKKLKEEAKKSGQQVDDVKVREDALKNLDSKPSEKELKDEEKRLTEEAKKSGQKVDEKKIKEDAKKNVEAKKNVAKKDDGRAMLGNESKSKPQGSNALGGAGPAHDVTGQPHNELPGA